MNSSRRIDASPEAVWKAVSDAGDFARFAEGIASTQLIGEPGEGMRRLCTDAAGGQWSETCTHWDAGRSYRMEVQVETYPWYYRFLLSELAQTWTVTPADDGTRTVLTLEFDGRMRWGPIGWVAGRLLGRRRPLESILEAYETEIVGAGGR